MTPRRTTPKAAAIYARISQDKAGEGLGVARQEALCRELADEKGWTVADTYVDNDVSAYNGKARAEYRRMLADIAVGQRDGVLCVDLDRLTRRPAELEEFMELADRKKIALANVSGDTDLSTSDGRFRARILGAVARQEGEKKAERVQREAEQAARRGIPRGPHAAFGYAADHVTIVDTEADLVRDAARRVLAGETVPAICRDWNTRGVRPPRGREWSAATLVRILRNPRYAGLRAYRGEVVAEGTWPPILGRGEWEALQGKLARVARVGRPSASLLAGIARCGRCGGPLWSSVRRRTDGSHEQRYQCKARPGAVGCGRLAVVQHPVDELVADLVLHALSGPALAKARKARRSDDRVERAAARDVQDAEERLQVLSEMFASGELSRREFTAGRDKARKRIAAATKVLDAAHGVRTDLPTDAGALRERWDAADVAWRRALIGTVVETIRVQPGRSGRVFDPERVQVVWKA